MPKLKQIVFFSFVLLSLIAAVWAYISLKNVKKPAVEAISVLPDSCLVYLNTSNFFELSNKIRSQSLIADKLKLFGEIDKLCYWVQTFDSLFSSNEQLHEELNENMVHFALYGKNPAWLVTFNIKQLGNHQNVLDGLGKVLNSKPVEKNIYSFEIEKKQVFYFSLVSGIVSLSNTQSLVRRAINTNGSKFEDSPAYKEYKASLSEDKLLSVFVNHQLYSSSKAPAKLNLTGLCKKGYSAGQIDIEPSGIKVNGFMTADSSEIIYALANQQSQSPASMLSILPYNTVSFRAYGFGSYTNLKTKLKQLQSNCNTDFWTKANAEAMYNLQSEFDANIKNNLLGFETAMQGQAYVAAELADTVKALEQLPYMSDTVFNTTGIRVFRLKACKGGLNLFEPLVNGSTLYAAVYNSYLFFAGSHNDMLSLFQSLNGNLLALNNESFNYYRSQNFPDEYNLLIYASPNSNPKNIDAFFKFKTSSPFNPFQNLRHFSYSLCNDAQAFKFRLQVLNEAESNAQDQNVLWTLNLDTVSHLKANHFVNHITHENEIVVQDEANTLYLVNAKGTVTWKKKMEEKILSEIYMVDLFNNNKYQMLFNTKNHIHLIDRNGNYVKGYPVDLPAEATSEMSLIHYRSKKEVENEKEFRIFIACADRSIYNYNIRGEAPEGFVPVKTEHEVSLPLQYVKVGESDYLVALDREGKIYIFGRHGEGRIGLKNRTLANCPAFYVDATNDLNTTNLVCLDDKSGLINKISFTDKKELLKLNMEHGTADVRFCLVDDNREMDMVLTRGNSILAFNFNGDLLVEKAADMELQTTSFYNDESHAVYCSINKDKEEVFVYDQLNQKSKKIKAGALPLISNLFNNGKKFMIVTNGKQLSCVPLD